jgi:TRAP transporter TAXI family solute receptor
MSGSRPFTEVALVKIGLFKLVCLVLSAALLSFSWSGACSARRLTIATATTGGTFYPVGAALATLISVKLAKSDGLTATAITSAGSGENVRKLCERECDLAILQGLYGAHAYHGRGDYQDVPMREMAGVTMLWRNVEHFALLRRHVQSGTVSDLQNLHQPFSMGLEESGTEGSGWVLLTALGIEPGRDFTERHLGYNASIDAMQREDIAGANIPGGVPVSAITQMYAMLGERAMVLDFTDAQLAAVNREFPLWSRYLIAPGTYPGQKHEIRTLAQPNILVASTALDEETVYIITRTLYENLEFLNSTHPATNDMDIGKAMEGMPMPLHPGAARYFEEVGLEIPLRLKPR